MIKFLMSSTETICVEFVSTLCKFTFIESNSF